MSNPVQHRGHRRRHCFVPPHLLRALAANGGLEGRRAAEATLGLDAALRMHRLLAAPPTSPAPGVPGHGRRRLYTAGGTQELPGRLVRSEGDPPSGDPATDEAYAGLGATYDLYRAAFGRDSVDDAGMPLVATVHYGRDYDNAAWNGEQMLFGDGDGTYFRRFTLAVDVTGHELTHGVTAHERRLTYEGQPGALNEHCSDAVGSMVKQYAASPPQRAAEADWLIGAGLFTAAVNGVAIRSMRAPGTAYDDPVLGRDPQPDHMTGYVETTDDGGGVHINSGIPNRAFALAAVALGGFTWEVAGRVWYATMRDPALSPMATFAEFAVLTVGHAESLLGADARDVVAGAWDEVGVALPVT